MKTSVLITAVSGTGKSTVCKALEKSGYTAYDIESIPGLYELVDEKTGDIITGTMNQIKEGVDWNCKMHELQTLLASQLDGTVFYCGGMSNTEEVWNYFDKVLILTVSDSTTEKRLSTRDSTEFGGSKKNRDWVLGWKGDVERRWLEMGGIEINAEARPDILVENILRSI